MHTRRRPAPGPALVPAPDAVPSEAAAASPGIRFLVASPARDSADLRSLRRWAAETRSDLVQVDDRAAADVALTHGSFHAVFVFLTGQLEEGLIQWMEVVRAAPGLPQLLVLADRPSMELVLLADRLGALEVLPLPLERVGFTRTVERLTHAAGEPSQALPWTDNDSKYALVGRDGSMLKVYKRIAQVAPSAATVLLQGQSGTGKEVVARAIHAHGPRAARPFVAVNCAAIPENLLESELFGHERGAFTGALTRRIGRVELSAGGTLFLDEIADMSLPLQAKILRAIQEREIERVGGGDPIPVDLRIIAATNRDLRQAIAQGLFREDLYYRLAVMTIQLPPLHDRGEDLLLLVGHFTRNFAARAGKVITRISDQALGILRAHEWSGNVRELRNVIERATLLTAGDTIRAEHLPEEFRTAAPEPGALAAPTPRTSGPLYRGSPRPGSPAAATEEPEGRVLTLAEVEALHIAQTLLRVGGQIGEGAELLGIHRNTLARKVREHGL